MIQNDENSELRIVKNKLPARFLTRWLVLLLFAGLVLVNAPVAFSGDSVMVDADKQAEQLSPAIKHSDVNVDVREIKDRLRELESKERQDYALELERQHHQVNWWLTILALLAALMAIGGGFIPFMMARKDKEIIELDKRAIEQDKVKIRALLNEIKGMKDGVEDDAEKIHQTLSQAKNKLRNFQSGAPSDNDKEINAAVTTVEHDENSDYVLKLRAEAVAASQEKNAHKAYTLWAALTELVEVDASAQFNAGYWAHELGDSAKTEEKLHWLKLAGRFYQQTLAIKPDYHEAAYNWGSALDDEARALSTTDLPTARTLWKQAGEKYQQALAIKPDYHEAAYNWGSALNAEALALSATDLPTARTLWKQAGEKYQQALAIKPDEHSAAHNWGSVLNVEALSLSATDLPTARTLWKQAGEKYQQALAIKPDKHESAYNWGIALGAEALALLDTDLPAARMLWKQAGEKYQQALGIKPNDHDVAKIWGSALLLESTAISTSEPEDSKELIAQAKKLLLEHAEDAPGKVAYNLACVYGLGGDVQTCLKWLQVSQEHKTLPDCEYIGKDEDLKKVRNDPDFDKWFKQVCP